MEFYPISQCLVYLKVVGFTASVGVGKASSMQQAVDHILKLCANIDAKEICTVKEFKDELAENVNKPQEGITCHDVPESWIIQSRPDILLPGNIK